VISITRFYPVSRNVITRRHLNSVSHRERSHYPCVNSSATTISTDVNLKIASLVRGIKIIALPSDRLYVDVTILALNRLATNERERENWKSSHLRHFSFGHTGVHSHRSETPDVLARFIFFFLFFSPPLSPPPKGKSWCRVFNKISTLLY